MGTFLYRGSNRFARPLGLAHLLAAVLQLFAASTVHAQAESIVWDAENRFERPVDVAPGKLAEICGSLERGDSIKWTFDADRPLQFNVHFHVGADIVFPEKRDAVASGSGTLSVESRQGYCWMWTNPSEQRAVLSVRLQRQPGGQPQ